MYTRVGIRCFRLLDLSLITQELKPGDTILKYMHSCLCETANVGYLPKLSSGLAGGLAGGLVAGGLALFSMNIE